MNVVESEHADRPEFEIVFVATMSSGKSTLINAILGRDLLPARYEAATANIARIHDIDGADHFRAEIFDKDGEKIGESDPLTPIKMEELNNIDGERPASVVEIYGEVPNIESKGARFVLSDTPGFSNSNAAECVKRAMDFVNEGYKPLIVYVLNGVQLETNDDSLFLDEVTRLVKSGSGQSKANFLFVLNKADEFDPDNGESVAKKIDDVKRYLSEKHGIENPRVFPTAARLAKFIRQTKCNDPALTAKDRRSVSVDIGWFVNEEGMHFTQFADFLSPATRDELNARLRKAKESNDKEELALLYSGVPSVELAIVEYINECGFGNKR